MSEFCRSLRHSSQIQFHCCNPSSSTSDKTAGMVLLFREEILSSFRSYRIRSVNLSSAAEMVHSKAGRSLLLAAAE